MSTAFKQPNSYLNRFFLQNNTEYTTNKNKQINKLTIGEKRDRKQNKLNEFGINLTTKKTWIQSKIL